MVDVSLVPVQEPRERCRRWERREGFQRLCANAFLLDTLRGLLDDVAGGAINVGAQYIRLPKGKVE